MTLARFKKEFDKSIGLAIKGAEAAIKGGSEKLFGDIIDSTPVATGQLKGNWIPTVNNPATIRLLGHTDPQGTGTKSLVSAVLDKFKLPLLGQKSLFLTNNLDYANRIEFGSYSNKAPNGMVRINVLKFKIHLEEAAKKSKV